MSKAESADLILKLYELRRDPTMREARSWIIGFFPESAAEIMQAMINAETSAYYRMVTSYWEMAAALVNHGAIDEEMFNDASGEQVMVFSKIEPFLPELREMMGSPKMLSNRHFNFGGAASHLVSTVALYNKLNFHYKKQKNTKVLKLPLCSFALENNFRLECFVMRASDYFRVGCRGVNKW